MSFRVSDHLRSNAIGYVALFFALGGTAYAIDGSLPGQNTVGSEDIINGEVKLADVGANAVGSAKIQDGAVEARDLHQNSVNSAKAVNDSLTGADLNESTLDGSAISGIPNRTARIHSIGWEDRGLFPGLSYALNCYPDHLYFQFQTTAGGTANAMIVANGVDPSPSTGYDFNVKNGATNQGTVLHPNAGGFYANYRLNDASGDAGGESQIVIDAGDKTYRISLHTYHRQGNGDQYCEAFGTATMAG